MTYFKYRLYTDTDSMIDGAGFSSIIKARRLALSLTRAYGNIIIKKDWENYMIVWKNGTCAYMKGQYVMDASKTYRVNENGTIADIRRIRRKSKPKTNEFGLNWNLK